MVEEGGRGTRRSGQTKNKPENVRIPHEFPMSKWMTLFLLALPYSLHPSVDLLLPIHDSRPTYAHTYVCIGLCLFCVCENRRHRQKRQKK